MTDLQQDLSEIHAFLACETPELWVENALDNQDIMLLDHAHCEKKAAMTAVNLIHRYPDDPELLMKMSRLAREELRHFEQVMKFIKKRKLRYGHMTAARYAAELREHVRKNDPQRIADLLIIGAFIEARSCERFAKIAPVLDKELGDFYISLLKSEARHYQDYLKLASKYESAESLDDRISFFREKERALIETPDSEFRFHSGPVLT